MKSQFTILGQKCLDLSQTFKIYLARFETHDSSTFKAIETRFFNLKINDNSLLTENLDPFQVSNIWLDFHACKCTRQWKITIFPSKMENGVKYYKSANTWPTIEFLESKMSFSSLHHCVLKTLRRVIDFPNL